MCIASLRLNNDLLRHKFEQNPYGTLPGILPNFSPMTVGSHSVHLASIPCRNTLQTRVMLGCSAVMSLPLGRKS